MTGHRIATVLVALVLAGCAAVGPGGSASPAASVAEPSTASAPTAAPSLVGSATPSAPAPTVAPSCPSGSLTVAAFLAADSRCHLADEVSVLGWWGARRADEPGEGRTLGWVLRGSMPFGARSETPEDILFVDETAVAPPSGWPDGIHWATVTGRRSASGDQRACHRDRGADVFAAPHCPSYLVATSVVESEAPPSALAGCLSMAAGNAVGVDVGVLTADPPACFGSRDVTVRGWLDIRYIIAGWEAPWGISPAWLWVPIGPWTVVSDTSNAESPSALLVYVDPARAVDVTRTNRWVLLTGHFADPKAQTCRITLAPGTEPPSSAISDAYARRVCEAHFVVTSIRDTNP